MEFVVDEVDIDVMAGFVIVDHDKEYDCSLQEEQIVEHKMVNGVNIPLQSVALWRDYYKWMHRDKKVAMIDQGYDAVLHSFSKKVQKQILEEENIQNEPEIWDLYSEDRKLLGRDHVRGEQLPAGCYHLVVHVWIRNSKGEYLISQRAASRPTNPLMWECVGGSVIKGEDSLQGAIREAKEEVGVDLLPENGRVLFTKTRKTEGERRFNDIMDVWLFIYDGEVDLKNATTDEVAQVTWMNRGQIMELFQENAFVETLNYFFTEVEKVPDIQAQK